MKNRIESFIHVVLILLLPFMFYIHVSGSPVNISLGDIFFPLAGLLVIIHFKRLLDKKRWLYIFYFLGLILSLFLSHVFVQRNEGILSIPYMGMIMEIVKTAIVGGYFYIAYMFIKDSRKYQLALYTLSIGSIPVGIIAMGAYISHLLEKPFFIKTFALEGYSGRVVGTFEDPNLYAFYLIMIFYISLWNSRIIRNKLASFGMILISGFSVILLVMTMSRSGWVAFGLSLVIFVLINIKHITKQSIGAVLVILCIVFIGVHIDYSIHGGKIVKTVMDRVENSLMQGEEVDRFQLTKAALKMGNDNFLFGIGKGNFPLNSYIYLGEDNVNYKNQYIPHNTLVGTYAQQGIVGLVIFLILPLYILYKMFKSKRKQNLYMFPLLIGFLVQSFAINVENVRFVWFLLGLLLAGTELDKDIEINESKKRQGRSYWIGLVILSAILIALYINAARYIYVNIAAYRGNIIEKTVSVPQRGIYTLSFDIQTNEELSRVEVYESGKLLKNMEFKLAYGKVEEDIALDKGATIRFVTNDEGWMKIRNPYLIKGSNILPLYSYPLVPGFVQKFMMERDLLVYVKELSFKQDIDIAGENPFKPFGVEGFTVKRYSNLSSIFGSQILYKEEIDSRYHLQLNLQYDSISKLLPGESQRNNISHAIAAYPKDWSWEIGEIYSIHGPRILTNMDFKLYGRFYDIDNKLYPDERYFEIPFEVIKEEQEILNLGEDQWINIRYSKNEENQIVMSYNSWIESKRYNLEPGKYNISIRAQGSLLEGEYSKLRIRDSYLKEIAVIDLGDTNKVYSIPYKVDEKEEGISFILELINYDTKEDIGDRRVFLEDWIRVE
ncbi:MAG: O-antigen ligase family protein [Epulopiscium sp.]|nr:O-antigen ligase family protein [Candidatus Epulonipiscium sp.]